MKNYLTLALLLLIFTSCEKETNFDSEMNTEFKSESKILFSSSTFKEISNTYSGIDKTLMNESLEERTLDGTVLYSMNLNNEGVDLRQLFFKIENDGSVKALIIENTIIEKTNVLHYDVLTTNNKLITKLDLVKVDDVRRFREPGTDEISEGGDDCYINCLAGYVQQCIEDGPIVIAGCFIAGNFITASCILRCL